MLKIYIFTVSITKIDFFIYKRHISMINFKIQAQDWPILKLKLQRKYNRLTDEDLTFQEGQEDELLRRLAKRLHRNVDYVLFTLSKEMSDLQSNSL